jgi:hypothetical protein
LKICSSFKTTSSEDATTVVVEFEEYLEPRKLWKLWKQRTTNSGMRRKEIGEETQAGKSKEEKATRKK